jgi:hypothetical protein
VIEITAFAIGGIITFKGGGIAALGRSSSVQFDSREAAGTLGYIRVHVAMREFAQSLIVVPFVSQGFASPIKALAALH